MNDNVIRYEKVTGTIPEMIEQNKKIWKQAHEDVKAGKVICLTELIGNAETIHLEIAKKKGLA